MRTGYAGIAVLALSCSASASSAAVVATDTFESYTAGSALVGQPGGGTGWSAEWKSNSGLSQTNATNMSVQDPGAPYPDGQRAEVLASAGNGGTAFRGLSAPLSDTAGSTYYISYDSQNTSGGTRFFGLALISGTTERQLIGQASSQSNWTVNRVVAPESNNTADSGINTSDPAQLLVKLVFGGTGEMETVQFWVNPDYSEPEIGAVNNARLVGTYTTTLDFGNIDRVRIGGGNTSTAGDFAAHWMDNLLITSTDTPFAGIPEPTSLGLAAAGAGLWLLRRRR